jgi:LPS export ABC transporter protein LptC
MWKKVSNKTFDNTAAGDISTLPRLLISAVVLVVIFLLLISCSFDYGSKKETFSGKIPDFILKKTSYTIERTGEHAIIFTADSLEMFESDHTAMLKKVTFVQQDDSLKELSLGSCYSAEINTNSRDAVLRGNIEVFSPAKGILLEADFLNWDNSTSLLSGGADDEVSIIYEDGSKVRGVGFRGDFTLNMFEFQEIIEGTLHYE